ncbi:MAG: MBL fold metallo-hydrolase [Williamsia sp.]|nr:MBL fold metallo-hydrolase [Williamsia sp.]
MIPKVFGKTPSGKRLARIMQSPNYKNGSFQNIEPTEVLREGASYMRMLRNFFNRPVTVKPPAALHPVKTDLRQPAGERPLVTWFGHSSYFIRSKNFNILVDPVFSGHASPVSFFGAAFKGTDAYTPEDFPSIDVLLITHDHYDHLDYSTILRLAPMVKQFVTSLGVGAHLEYWGIDAARITELDWWENKTLAPGINITATPARHFSGRMFVRNKTLWSSFVLQLPGYRLFLGGDSGYDAQFKQTGKTHGPFDLAILECGQYGDDWPSIHMKPEETVQAAQDLQARVLMPVHWGKFVLALHPWNEPVKRVVAAAEKAGLPVTTLQIGETYGVGDAVRMERWWEVFYQ